MNYITLTYPQTASIQLQGYMFDHLLQVYLSSTDITFPSLCSINVFTNNNLVSARFPGFSGYPLPSNYYNSSDKNHLSVSAPSFNIPGTYDIILFNDAGYDKLSNYGFLIDNISSRGSILTIDGSILVTIQNSTIEIDFIVTPPIPSPPLLSPNLVTIYSKTAIENIAISASNNNPMYPVFNGTTYDYAITACGPVESSIGYTLFINGSAFSSGTTVTKNALQVYDGTNAYYVRFLPDGLPIAPVAYGPTSNYSPGYYLVGGWFFRTAPFNSAAVSQYYSIYNQNGVPVWFTPSLSAESVSLQMGNRSNRVITNGNIALPRYVIDMGVASLSTTGYNVLTSTNSSPWAVHGGTNFNAATSGWDIHESLVLGGSYGDNNKLLSLVYTTSGFYIQIQNPNGTINWEWDSANYLSAYDSKYDTNDLYHVNSVDVNSTTGDVLVSMRNTSSVISINRVTKNIDWAIQGSYNLPNYCLSATMLSNVRASTTFLTPTDEPYDSSGRQYNGPICAHDARWRTDLNPTNISQKGTGYQAAYISLYDDESLFRPTNAAAPYWPSTATTLFNNCLSSRAVIYEVNVADKKAYHHSSVFNPNNIPTAQNFGNNPHCSPFTGSATIIAEDDGTITTGIDFSRAAYVAGNPIYQEFRGNADTNWPGSSGRELVLALDFPGINYYRIIKVPSSSFDIGILRTTSGFYLNEENLYAVPTITLNGSNPTNIVTGATFTDPGAVVTDSIDSSRTIYAYSGTVNTAVTGTYTLSYSAVNSRNIPAAPVTRTVNVTDTFVVLLTSSGLKSIRSSSTINSLSVSSANITTFGTSYTAINDFTLNPTFSAITYQDYAVQTNLNSGTTMSYILNINGTNRPVDTINVDQALQVYDNEQVYYIRFVNTKTSLGIANTYSTSYTPGYYLVSQGNGSHSQNNGIYNQYGIPVWYMNNYTPINFELGAGTNTLIGHDSGSSAIVNINPTSITYTATNFQSWDIHECCQINSTDPALAARYGNIIGEVYVSPWTVYEYTSSGNLVWTWNASDYFQDTNPDTYHVNSIDVHPHNGNILISMRHVSDVMCIEYTTKKVLWVLGTNIFNNLKTSLKSPTPSAFTNTVWITGANIKNEPVDPYTGRIYNGTIGNHDARWHPEITPLSGVNNIVISVFDDQSPTGSGGFSQFPATTRNARGVIYEIDTSSGVAYSVSNVITPYGASPYRGSYTVLQEGNSFSHTADFCQYTTTTDGGSYINLTAPAIIEWKGPILTSNQNSKERVFDLWVPYNTGYYASYRARKVPLSSFNIDYLRGSAGLNYS